MSRHPALCLTAMANSRVIAMWVATLSLFIAVTAASPQVNFPFSSQLPPLARVGQPYSFQFAATTFQPDPDKLQYSLIGNPAWLFLSGKNRTLWGTPSASDIGNSTFTIAAAGEAGAVANMESRLLVTDSPAPTLNANVSQQLSEAGPLSGPTSLTLLPSKPFAIQFSSDAFQSAGNNLSYYATLADHTPIPAWISFDSTSVQFAGTTPPLNSSPQSYDILLIASDVPGYTTGSISFTITISDHQLSFRPSQQTINATKGERVDISGLRGQLFLDNIPVGDGDVQSASAELPPWLSFDNNTFDISGIPPSGLMSQNMSISVTDKYGDTAEHFIYLKFKSQLFDDELGTLDITTGQPFEYEMPRSVLSNNNEHVTFDFGPLGKWLTFDPAASTISGTIPADFATGNVEATMTATSSNGQVKESQTFHLQVSSSGTSGGTSGENSTASRHANGSDEASSADRSSHQSQKAGMIAGSVVGAIIGSLILFAFMLLFCRRTNRSKGYISPKSPRSPRKIDISRPIMIQEEWETTDKTFDADLEKGEGDDTPLERTPERPPQLHLDLAQKRKDSHSPASSIGEGESKILNDFDDSPWGFKEEAGPSHRPHDSMKIPTAIARRESGQSGTPAKQRRRTTAVYRDPQRRSGLPINRRLTGLGHGRHTNSPSRSNNSMSAYRRPLSFHSYSTTTASILSTVPSALPQPSAARHSTQLTTPMENRCSIRLVSKNANSTCDSLVDRRTIDERRRSKGRKKSYDSLLDRRTIDEKRRSYIRKRASAQSPFFAAANSSRVSSSSYKLPPAFINESELPAKPAPSPLVSSIVFKAEEKVERELPESLRIRKPSETPSVEPPRLFTGSLRQPPKARSFVTKNTSSAGTVQNRDRMAKRYDRPSTAVYTGTAGRRPSTRQSLRAAELKSSLNSLTGSKIYEDAELSESVYSSEEEDIEEYEKRTTVKPEQFSLPPLDYYRTQKEDAESKRNRERESKRDSKKEGKRLSQRDPTPYSLVREHGGKENQSSTYSLSLLPSIVKGKGKATVTSQSPERPRTIATTTAPKHPTHHSRSESRTTTRSSTQHNPQNRPLSRQHSHHSRHSRTQSKSGGHSRSHSRHLSTTKHKRDSSRTQSSAYPYFDISTLPSTLSDPRKSTNKDELASSSPLPHKDTSASLLTRDGDGNIVNYGVHEDPTIEQLASSSIGFRTSNGRINSSARQSRLAQQVSTRHSTNKRETTIGPSTPSPRNTRSATHVPYSIGLGLTLFGRAESTPGVESRRGRERTPLSVLDDGNGASPERLRVIEGKGRRPGSGEVDEELRVGASRKGRTTWGSGWRRVVSGRKASFGKSFL